jgi:glycogen debranching enzyme
MTHLDGGPLQPLLHDAVVVYSAPTQVWSDASGELGSRSIHGIYHSDTRLVRTLTLSVGGERPEHIATYADGPSSTTFVSLLRRLDGQGADPKVRLDRRRVVGDGFAAETLTITSALDVPRTTTIELTAVPDFSSLHAVKAGIMTDVDRALASNVDGAGIRFTRSQCSLILTADGAQLSVDADHRASIVWNVVVPAHGSVSVGWLMTADDPSAVVQGVRGPSEWSGAVVTSDDPRLQNWVRQALSDLDALRLTADQAPHDTFLAAGAPWFFTLFGRDSLWAARFLLPLGTDIAASTLRALATMQGTTTDAETAEQPGKIMHELRPATLTIPSEGVTLPPLYYGTVDATALWICLLHDAWLWGMADDEVAALLPALEAALAWMRDYGDSDGDGFLEYIDTSGHGLANQGWKDSSDSIQWRDGRIAKGPIALCEVQGYAYEAAMSGAQLLEHFGRPGADTWRRWAAELKARFAESFWIDAPSGPEGTGPYPAVALDADKRRVDTVTSNLGHLLGTGILDEEGARLVAARLVSPELKSGYGLRTMSSDSAGFWPLSYHGGSVWTHDTAIAIAGLGRSGFVDEAASLIDGLLAAADGFDYRMPELHSGDAAEDVGTPVPYPAACRPQAWSAAAAVSVLATMLGLEPDAPSGILSTHPFTPAPAGALSVNGLRFGGRQFALSTDAAGAVLRNTSGRVGRS